MIFTICWRHAQQRGANRGKCLISHPTISLWINAPLRARLTPNPCSNPDRDTRKPCHRHGLTNWIEESENGNERKRRERRGNDGRITFNFNWGSLRESLERIPLFSGSRTRLLVRRLCNAIIWPFTFTHIIATCNFNYLFAMHLAVLIEFVIKLHLAHNLMLYDFVGIVSPLTNFRKS